ncbi:MAG: histidine kinase, partial [Pseudobutyrivibrio sp.]|nr:histidine kinase [Pseudobutyrivibrio sp.]
MGQIGISALELWGAVFCLIAAILIDRGKIVEHRENKQLGLMLLINALILVCDVFAITYNGEPGKLGLYIVGIANFWLYFLIYTLEIYFIRYLRTIIEVNGGKFSIGFAFAGAIIMSVSLVVLIANIWTKHLYYFDIKNYYHRGPYYNLAMIPVFICFVIIAVIVVFYRKYFSKLQLLGLVIYLVFPITGAFVMAFSKDTSSFINIALTIALLMMYAGYEVEKNKRMLAQADELLEKERINEEFRNLMLWTQIQPHFIYNNLYVIQFLCKKDPELAAEAVVHLSA